MIQPGGNQQTAHSVKAQTSMMMQFCMTYNYFGNSLSQNNAEVKDIQKELDTFM